MTADPIASAAVPGGRSGAASVGHDRIASEAIASDAALQRARHGRVAYDRITVGDRLPVLQLPPVDRTTLALFCGASGDHNPIHVDVDFARRAGIPDVFAQGMLGMAWLGRLLTNWIPQSRLRRFDVRFLGVTHLGHAMTCSGRVTDKREADGEPQVVLAVQSVNQYGQPRIAGEAIVGFS